MPVFGARCDNAAERARDFARTGGILRTAIVGGGPAGLYLSILLKKSEPTRDVVVLERNPADATFGWGVVFSDQTLERLRAADEPSYRAITDEFAHWDDIDIHVRGRTITSSGHGFSGIARVRLLALLQRRALELGAELRFCRDIASLGALQAEGLGDAAVVVAADGANSVIRRERAASFVPTLDERSARFIWLGTTLRLDAFTFIFVDNEHGLFQAHAYRFDEQHSTFIVECDEASWRAARLDVADTAATITYCERLFAPWLQGHRLISNAAHRAAAPWSRFLRVSNERWWDGRVVLIGDAAHTAHFSVGSGTKLAMEDAIVLARELVSERPLAEAFAAYQAERQLEALRLQNAARNSMEWFENVKRYIHLEPEQFAYSLLTRSQRVSHENLRLRDRRYLEGVERWFAARAASPPPAPPPPPMFTPYRLRALELRNRVVVAPMDMYSAVDGTPNEFHLAHLGARALGGAGLLMTEMTCVAPEARITFGCTGMYTAEHVAAWQRIVAFVHDWTPAKLCLQLGHSGRKGATRLMWEGADVPLDEGGWEVIGPSALPYGPAHRVPRAMTRADMDRVRGQFVDAVAMAVECDFDMIELHCAHGYLLSSFLTPISNQRDDEYGGPLENRLRYPLEVFAAMRAAWPAERPMSVRVSATDWIDGGITGEHSVIIARAFVAAGADIIHVSTGQTTPRAQPVYGRMFQTPFSDWIRNEARVATIAVGNVTEPDQVNSIIAAGRADLVALGRPHLADPHWTQRAAAELGWTQQWWPNQYLTGKRQLERLYERRRELQQAAE